MDGDDSDKALILVVDDEADLLEAIKVFLQAKENAVYEVVTTTDPKRAALILQLESHRIKLILLDLHMPNFSGLELLHQIRSTPELAQVPILIISGDRTGRRKVAEQKDPYLDFLLKPFNPEVLYYRVMRSGLLKTA
ncbi:MAG: response regulator [Acidobacteriota bacterium]|nr:response regulator [Blastocatellia bacterium]MDW8411946.1 response regulator [Acidobacteriota bacterium]